MHSGLALSGRRVQSPRHPPEVFVFGRHNTCRFIILQASCLSVDLACLPMLAQVPCVLICGKTLSDPQLPPI